MPSLAAVDSDRMGLSSTVLLCCHHQRIKYIFCYNVSRCHFQKQRKSGINFMGFFLMFQLIFLEGSLMTYNAYLMIVGFFFALNNISSLFWGVGVGEALHSGIISGRLYEPYGMLSSNLS